MSSKPPPLPFTVLKRVWWIAILDGSSVLMIGGIFALAAAIGHDGIGALVGCAATGASAMELHGAFRLRAGDPDGTSWLVRGQLVLLATILIYAGYQLTHFDPQPLRQIVPPDLERQVAEAGMSMDTFLRELYVLGYGTVGFVALLYQGGLALYFHTRRAVIQQALDHGEF